MRYWATLLASCSVFAQTWISHPSGTTASLRGISVPNATVAWASGSGGTYLVTIDGGSTWRVAKVPGAEQLDFRDIQAIDARTVYLLAAGPGDKSRVYKTTDAGSHWTLQLTNPDLSGFFDAFAFWDARQGILLGDPVAGEFTILTTSDGGAHWQKQRTHAALPNEGAFAASGTCLIATGTRDAWFVTGGPGGARVFHSRDRGRSWTVTTTPLHGTAATAGIFSIAFRDPRHGVIVGGDYAQPANAGDNVAITSDGGRTWQEPRGRPNGYRSAVAYLAHLGAWIAAGPTGSDISRDDGETWRAFDSGAYNALSFAPDGSGWADGPEGRIAKFKTESRD